MDNGVAARIQRRMRSSNMYRKVHAALRKAIDGRFDRRYGIHTRGMMPAKQLRSRDPLPEESWGYMGTPPREFDRLIRALAVRTGDYHFVDIGSGKARATIMAAMYDFRSVTGVELSRVLHDVALRNVAAMRNHGVMKCEPELLNLDALEYEFPLLPLLIYAYNPFKRRAMEHLVDRVAETYRTAPRHIVFAYRIPQRYATCARVFEEHPLFTEVALSASRLPRAMRLFEIPAERVEHA